MFSAVAGQAKTGAVFIFDAVKVKSQRRSVVSDSL